MNKNFIIGIAAVATGGLVLGGITVYDRNHTNDLAEAINGQTEEKTAAEDKEKIKDLVWEEWSDTDKYSFCLGNQKIENSYSDPALDNNGTLNYETKELLVYNKESNRLLVVAREIDYKYKGQIDKALGGLSVSIPVTETGFLAESYGKNEMPVRIDYANFRLFTSPDTKKTNWVKSAIGEEIEMINPRFGCAGEYKLDNAPGKDLLAGAENIAIDRQCREKDISGSYEGQLVYKCQGVDYRQAKAWLDGIKTKEELQNTKDTSIIDNETEARPETDDASARSEADSVKSAGDEINEAIKASSDIPPDYQVKEQLEQLRKEMQADQTPK